MIPTWCPGCDNYLLLSALKQAIAKSNLPLESVVVVYDIGCIGNIADFLPFYGIHALHGRSVATALGIKLYRPELTVIVVGGDGGIYGEGLNHLIAAARLNLDLTVLVANNHLYSLTTGQTSPTTPRSSTTKSTPLGNPNLPLDPLTLMAAVNPQAQSIHIPLKAMAQLQTSIQQSLLSPHFTLIDVEERCVTFGKQLD